MADRPHRGRWTAVVGCLVAVLAGCTAEPNAVAPSGQVRVLQLNLCGSGEAACYTGRSTAEAAEVLRAEAPDLVTLNEVCRGDVAVLERALAEVVPGGAATSAFQAARDRRSGEPYRCRGGEEYGNGIVSRWPTVPGTAAVGGIYPQQVPDDPEERSWLCLRAAGTQELAVCTTHLADTRRDVALAQCRYLFGTVIAGLRASAPVVVGADLNLGSGDGADLASCLPAGSARVDDGGPQLVVAAPEVVVVEVRTIDLRGATDHSGLLVTFGRGA